MHYFINLLPKTITSTINDEFDCEHMFTQPHFKCPYEAERDLTLDCRMNSGLIYTAVFDSPRGKIKIMVQTGCNIWLNESLVFFHGKKFGSVSITFLIVINGLSLQWQTQAIFHTATPCESSSVIIFHLSHVFVSAIIALQNLALCFFCCVLAGKLFFKSAVVDASLWSLIEG